MNCDNCNVSLQRKVFCSTRCRVAYHRHSKPHNANAKHSTPTIDEPSTNEIFMPCEICGKDPISHWKNKLGHSHK